MTATRVGDWLALYSSAGLDGVRGSIAVALIGIVLSVYLLTLLIFSAHIEMLVAWSLKSMHAYGGLVEARIDLSFHHIDKHNFLKAYLISH